MKRQITEAERKAASEAMKAFHRRTHKGTQIGNAIKAKKKPATPRRIPAQ